MNAPLRWGVLGTGNISAKFAADLATVRDRAVLVAVGSRDAASGAAFARAHGAAGAGDYASVLADPRVDAVYIALTNDLHAEWSIRCAEAGKHVLCEKPATMDAVELERVLAACARHRVFWYEAYAYRCHPRYARLAELIAGGAIGRPALAHASFSFDGRPLGRPRLWDPARGGGGLMDVGVYPLSLLRLIARFAGDGEPLSAQASGHLVDGVDAWAAGTLRFASGLTATFNCGVACAVPSVAQVYGSEGWIEVPEPWKCRDAALILHRTGEAERRIETVDDGLALYAREALMVGAWCGRALEAPACPWDDSRGQMRVLDALRGQLGVRWPGEAR
jgi:predicted dehydrogenase